MSTSETSLTKYLLPPDHIKALIFDLDGTIADTMPAHLQAWQLVAKHFEVPITDQMIIDLAGTPTLGVVVPLNKIYGWKLNPMEVQKMKQISLALVKKDLGPVLPIFPVYNVAKAYLGKLPMSIGTGSIRSNALAALNDMKITSWFDIIVSAQDVKKGKPHPETYLRCAQAMHVDPALCLLYEDGQQGIEAGIRAGMRVVNIETGEIFEPNS